MRQHRATWALLALALLVAIVVAGPSLTSWLGGWSLSEPPQWHQVVDVLDGDDLVVDSMQVHLEGVNAPGGGSPFAMEAHDHLRSLVWDRAVRLEYDAQRLDEDERTLAYVYLPDGTFVNLVMVLDGYAQVNTRFPNTAYRAELQTAEYEARAAGRVIWATATVPLRISRVQADARGPDEVNLNGEVVTIHNESSEAIDLDGLILHDRGFHEFTFPSLPLGPNDVVNIHTGSGASTPTALFWGRANPVWGNDGDGAFLRTREGLLIDSYTYGTQ